MCLGREMGTGIRIIAGDIVVRAELSDTACARKITGLLPIDASPDEWGDEFYFGIPVRVDLDETATDRVRVGDIGYWPPGKALAIFFGPTPMSTGPDPVPASKVNVVGRIIGDAALLKSAKGSKRIRIEMTGGNE
jgi:hypothetical protein